jgi:hypothetical protein
VSLKFVIGVVLVYAVQKTCNKCKENNRPPEDRRILRRSLCISDVQNDLVSSINVFHS